MNPILQDNDPFTQPSFSLSNRLGRLAWGVCCALLFRPSPRVLHGWRSMLLRLFGARIGQHTHIYPKAKIWAPWNLDIGNFVWVGDEANLYSMDRIVIADYAVVSQGAHLCCGSHDIHSANFQLIAAPIVIGSKAWICAEAFVGLGVTVPAGMVLGARGVLCKTVTDPWTVWAGVPAKKIGVRQANFKSIS